MQLVAHARIHHALRAETAGAAPAQRLWICRSFKCNEEGAGRQVGMIIWQGCSELLAAAVVSTAVMSASRQRGRIRLPCLLLADELSVRLPAPAPTPSVRCWHRIRPAAGVRETASLARSAMRVRITLSPCHSILADGRTMQYRTRMHSTYAVGRYTVVPMIKLVVC